MSPGSLCDLYSDNAGEVMAGAPRVPSLRGSIGWPRGRIVRGRWAIVETDDPGWRVGDAGEVLEIEPEKAAGAEMAK